MTHGSAAPHEWGYVSLYEPVALAALVVLILVTCAWFAWTLRLCMELRRYEGG